MGSGAYGATYLAIVKDKKLLKEFRRLGILGKHDNEIVVKKMLLGGILDKDSKILKSETSNFLNEGKLGREIIGVGQSKNQQVPSSISMDALLDGIPVVICRKEEKGNAVEYLKKLNASEGDKPPSTKKDRRLLLPRIFSDILSNVSFLHDNNILHRDIAGENICLSKDHAVLIDFGKARKLIKGEENVAGEKDEQLRIYAMDKEALWTRTYSKDTDIHAYQVMVLQLMAVAAGCEFQSLKDAVLQIKSETGEWKTAEGSDVAICTMRLGNHVKLERMHNELLDFLIKHKDSVRCQQVFEMYNKFIPVMMSEKFSIEIVQKTLQDFMSTKLRPTTSEVVTIKAEKKVEEKTPTNRAVKDKIPTDNSKKHGLGKFSFSMWKTPKTSTEKHTTPTSTPAKGSKKTVK